MAAMQFLHQGLYKPGPHHHRAGRWGTTVMYRRPNDAAVQEMTSWVQDLRAGALSENQHRLGITPEEQTARDLGREPSLHYLCKIAVLRHAEVVAELHKVCFILLSGSSDCDLWSIWVIGHIRFEANNFHSQTYRLGMNC